MPIQFDNSATGTVTLKSPSSGTVNLTLPSADGTSSQVIQTDGSGALSFASTVTSIVAGTNVTVSGATGAVTVNTTATSANTASTIVARDASGNFSAGAITATGVSSSGNITATSSANHVSSRPPDDARNTGYKMSDGSDLGELNRSSEYFSDVVANCNGYMPNGNCSGNSTYTPPNGNWWTWGVSGVPTSNCTNSAQYDFAGGTTSTLYAVTVSYNYDAYYVAADEIGGVEYRRNYKNCNCGNCSTYTPSGFNCYTNCNCNCNCDCNCCD